MTPTPHRDRRQRPCPGTNGDDIIFAFGGNDTADGRRGNDITSGGNDLDTPDGRGGGKGFTATVANESRATDETLTYTYTIDLEV